jgi:hypothetical protein
VRAASCGTPETEIDAITDPARLARLDLAAFYGGD